MPFTIVRQDITTMKVDAIVNATNTYLQQGGGVCGAIFKQAGEHALQKACDQLSPVPTGEAVITPGFNLPAQWIIHAVGPIYTQWTQQESETHLRNSYLNALKLAHQHNCKSIAFPLISSGIYGYPKEEALKVATSSIQSFLYENEIDIYLVVYDSESFEISEKLLGEISSYIDENYVDSHHLLRQTKYKQEVLYESTNYTIGRGLSLSLDDMFEDLDEPFSTTLLRIIDHKGYTDVEVYKKANISRKLFSKIRSGKNYIPSKKTIIALALALRLDLEETDNLLEKAGYTLSHSSKFDVIVEYFIIHERYDIYEINEVLFKYDQPLLGG